MGGYNQNSYNVDPYLTQVTEESAMADKSKLVFVNTDGDFEESSVADSLKYASYKTANYELTDALLGDVTNKMIKSDGSRAFAADQSMGGFKLTGLAAGSANGDAIRYEQLVAVQNQIANLEFQDSVINLVTAAPGSPVSGDRYLVIATATGAFAGKENQIAEYNGASWDFILPATGMFLSSDAASDKLYYYNGSAWVEKYFEATTASTGLTKVGMDIRIDSSAAGNGLGFSSGVLSVNVDDSGVEINSDTLRLKDLGVSTAKLAATSVTAAKLGSDVAGEGLTGGNGVAVAVDWSTAYNDSKAIKASDLSSVSSGKGASIIGLEDAGGYTSATNVEAAIQELYAAAGGASYTVGSGGVTKGDLVYLSANNTVSKMPINAMQRAIGSALSTVAAAGTVQVQGFDYVITGALTGATAGARYYWDGSALTTTMPSAGGAYVWQVGVAKNATDLITAMEFIKKNS